MGRSKRILKFQYVDNGRTCNILNVILLCQAARRKSSHRLAVRQTGSSLSSGSGLALVHCCRRCQGMRSTFKNHMAWFWSRAFPRHVLRKVRCMCKDTGICSPTQPSLNHRPDRFLDFHSDDLHGQAAMSFCVEQVGTYSIRVFTPKEN